MNFNSDTFSSLLKRYDLHNYKLKNNYILERNNKDVSKVRMYQYYAIAILLFALGVMFYLSIVLGIIILACIYPLYQQLRQLNNQDIDNQFRKISFNSNQITIVHEADKSNIIVDEISEIKYSIEKADYISTASIHVVLTNNTRIKILDIFGENKNFIEEDVQIISHVISDLIYN